MQRVADHAYKTKTSTAIRAGQGPTEISGSGGDGLREYVKYCSQQRPSRTRSTLDLYDSLAVIIHDYRNRA